MPSESASSLAPAPADPARLLGLIGWLMSAGRESGTLEALQAGLCAELGAWGIPVTRMMWLIRTLHPQVRGVSYLWSRDHDGVEAVERPHGSENSPAYRASPIRAILDEGVARIRIRLDRTAPPYPYDILDALKAEGATDYVGLPMPLSSGRINVMTFSTRASGGFAAADLALIEAAIPALSTVIEAMALRRMAVTLLDTYVGRNAGARILSGDIRRGTGLSLKAVLWYCDLRGFTSLADRLPQADLIALLNGYFEIMGGAVESRGAEILKFIGDALLAIFPLADDRDEAAACARALDATGQALADMDALNRERKAWGQPSLSAGIALHVGEVMYGNIGAATRLDFTVIGPAVNLASRLEGLCRRMDRTVLISEAFARACPDRVVSLGWQPVRGLRDPVQVFGLRPL